MRGLLDVNVLIALFDEDHVFNERAHTWLEANAAQGIATCPLTENGLVRILSHPGYSKSLRLTPSIVVERLAKFLGAHDHTFWPDALSLRSPKKFRIERLLGSRQLTDVYLLALAVRNKGRLVTLDEGIPHSAVHGAKGEHLVMP